MDADGKKYITFIKNVSQSGLVKRSSASGSLRGSPLLKDGFVFQQDGRIVGNLTLTPLRKRGEWIYFLSNVAVHPDFRSLGIAKHLIATALGCLGKNESDTVW